MLEQRGLQIVRYALSHPDFHVSSETSHRYHDTTSSFAALATQSSMLSQSASALFDKDHPSMAGKGSHSIHFRELKPDHLTSLRQKLGLTDWSDEASTNA